jgi:predicted transcriptional regulator
MSPRRRQLPAIADAELVVLKALWDGGPATVRELLDRLGNDWAYTTVQTLVARLHEKGYLRADRRGMAHVFTAALERDEVAGRRVEELASSLLDGAVAPLLLRLVENSKFSAAEIAAFRELLRKAEAKQKGGEARS